MDEQYDKIYRYCYYKVGDASLAEDLTQETFLKFFSQNKTIKSGKTMAYLYTIARNNCMDVFRKQKREILDCDSSLFEQVTSVDMTDTFIESIDLSNALSKLSSEEKELILLRYANELKIKEIAAFKNESRFTISRKINRIIENLKNELKGEA